MQNISIFNHIQHLKLEYYNKQRILQLGCQISEKLLQREYVPYLGLAAIGLREDLIEKLDEKLKKKYKKYSTKTDCLYITAIGDNSPAKLWGIKEGDIIYEIDGFTLKTGEELVNYICSLHPFDWVNLRIKRGKKELNFNIELTCSYNN